MFDVNDFLDRAKRAAGVTSDYALGVKVLGHAKNSTVSNWRAGRSAPDARSVLKLCELTGDDPEHVVACLQAMRAANDEESGLWQRIAARLKQQGSASLFFALALGFLAVGMLAGAPALADEAASSLRIMSNSIQYAVK